MRHPLAPSISAFSDLADGKELSLLLALGVALFAASLVIAYRHALSRFLPNRNDGRARQCSHVGNPPRLGGVAVIVGIFSGVLVSDWLDLWVPLFLILSAGPAFLAGLFEDCGYSISASYRLLAAFVSSAMAVFFFDIWVTRADFPGLDQVMVFSPLAIVLTLMLSAGFCHATNLVDGMNGLVGTVLISAAVGLAVLAHSAGQSDLALLAALLGAAMSGFVLFNWPFGTIFMGDAGCYGLGHILIWIAILLADSVPNIAAPALLLILFWPFADMLHSILRRLAGGAPVFVPDRLHLHQKVRRCIEINLLGGARRRISNPLAILFLFPAIVMPVVAGVVLAERPGMAWVALVLFGTLFAFTHVVITRVALTRRKLLANAGHAAFERNLSLPKRKLFAGEVGQKVKINES